MHYVYKEVWKRVLVKKIFANGLNIGVTSMSLSQKEKKTAHGMETHWLSGNENVPGAAISKEGHPDSLLGHKRPINIDFLKKEPAKGFSLLPTSNSKKFITLPSVDYQI